MNRDRLFQLAATYRRALLEDVVPFWTRHSPDREFGGYFTQLDRDGSLYGTDKPIWLQGREAWLFATLYNEVEPRAEWLELAQSGCDFLARYAFDERGKMYFCVARDGRPLRMRRYVFSEVFGCIAFAALGRATRDVRHMQTATRLYDSFVRHLRTPGTIAAKVDARTRPMKGLSPLMCLLNIADTLIATGCTREAVRGGSTGGSIADGAFAAATDAAAGGLRSHAELEADIDSAAAEILRDFVKHDRRIVLETVSPGGGAVDGPDGRTMNPGHAIECAWFLLDVARRRGDSALAAAALPIIDYAMERGWDAQYGGLLYFVDVDGRPATQLEHDMKLWWPHNEALIAALMAYDHTGDPRYAAMFEKLHEWTWRHFPDPQYGEWFGYLRRDGAVSTPLKGGMWKGAFHVPRCLLRCWRLLEGRGSSGAD